MKNQLSLWATIAFFLAYSMICSSMATIETTLTKPTRKHKDIEEYQLKNGQKIILKQDTEAPLVSFQVWYRVGSRDEEQNLTGIAHFLEHMMFKGTKNFRKGEIAQSIQLRGGDLQCFY